MTKKLLTRSTISTKIKSEALYEGKVEPHVARETPLCHYHEPRGSPNL